MARNRAVGIVIRGDDLLVVRRIWEGRDYVVFPGGGIEEGESPDQATIREIREETSVDASITRLLYELSYPNETLHSFFSCEYVAGEPKLGDSNEKELMTKGEEYYEPKWLPLNDLHHTVLLPTEVKDWLLEDLAKNFSEHYPRTGIVQVQRY